MTDNLEAICAKHRELALQQPMDIWMLRKASVQPQILAKYSFKWGKFYVSITYETHCKPRRWHAQVSILEPISEIEFGAMQEAMLATESWTGEDMKQAMDILGECLAPEVVKSDQPIQVHTGLWSRHLMTPDQREDQRGERSNIIVAGH